MDAQKISTMTVPELKRSMLRQIQELMHSRDRIMSMSIDDLTDNDVTAIFRDYSVRLQNLSDCEDRMLELEDEHPLSSWKPEVPAE